MVRVGNTGLISVLPRETKRSRKGLVKMNAPLYGNSMTVLKAHFDGNVLIPDEPVDLPRNCPLEIRVSQTIGKSSGKAGSFKCLSEVLEKFPENPDWPEDGAAQLDHYLYGTAKRK